METLCKKILIADDSKEVLVQWSVFLKHSKVEYKTAENGREATEDFGKDHYDAVFLDIDMPEMNGFEAAKIIKRLKPNCPVLAISSRDSNEDFLLMGQAGFDGYLTKPLRASEAFEKINCLLTTQ